MKNRFSPTALVIGVLTSSMGVRVRRFFGFVLGGGAVGQGVVRGVVRCSVGGVYGMCMGECTQLYWIRFWEATGFFNVMMQECILCLLLLCFVKETL